MAQQGHYNGFQCCADLISVRDTGLAKGILLAYYATLGRANYCQYHILKLYTPLCVATATPKKYLSPFLHDLWI